MISKNCKNKFKLFALLFITTIQVGYTQNLELGEELFSNNCASCHYLGPEISDVGWSDLGFNPDEEPSLVLQGIGSH